MRDPTAVTLTTGKTLYEALYAHMLYLGSSRDAPAKLLNLTGEDLSGVDFTGWNLDKGRFTSCNFTGSLISDDTLYSPLFITCTMVRTTFAVRNLSRARFNACDCSYATFQEVTFVSCNAWSTNIGNADFSNSMPGGLVLYITDPQTGDADYNGISTNWTAVGDRVTGSDKFQSERVGASRPRWKVSATAPVDMV